MALSPAERNRLVKVLGLLSSTHDGERAAAGLLATKIVRSAGACWDDLVQPVTPHRPPHGPEKHRSTSSSYATGDAGLMADLQLCRRHFDELSGWEASLVANLTARVRWSPGQKSKLAEIAAELRSKGHT